MSLTVLKDVTKVLQIQIGLILLHPLAQQPLDLFPDVVIGQRKLLQAAGLEGTSQLRKDAPRNCVRALIACGGALGARKHLRCTEVEYRPLFFTQRPKLVARVYFFTQGGAVRCGECLPPLG